MIASRKSYPAMKDSGVPWLGTLPAHWRVLPNRAIFTEVKERDHPEADMLSVTIKKGVIRQKALLEDSSKKDSSNLDRSAYKLVRPGDIAYNKMRAWQGAVGVSEYEGIVSPAYVVQRPCKDAEPRYLHHLLRTPAFAKEAERWSYGITSDMWSLRPEHFKMIYSCLPPLQEQAAIIRFLDHADRRIRLYIRAKQKLIRLLEEQKQAIIHQAVTRGLDPDVRLKPSGAEWLGDMPQHWKTVALKHLLSRVDYGTSEAGRVAGRIGLLSMRNIQDGEVVGSTAGYLDDVPDVLLLKANDLLFTRTNGNPDLVGKIGIYRGAPSGPLSFASYLVRLRVLPPHDPDWLHMVLSSHVFWAFARSHALVNLQTNLNSSKYVQFLVPLPPPAEQAEIAQTLNERTKRLRDAISLARRQIDLALEYRTRLIADVVTGKLDVREAAAQLPDEIEESDQLEGAEIESDAEEADAADADDVPEEAEA